MRPHVYILTLFFLFTGCQQQFEDTRPVRKDITEAVFASGKLTAEGTYNLIAKSDGYLVSIHFEVGDIVSKGTVLAAIENEESRFNTKGNQELLDIAAYNAQQNAPALSQARTSIEIARQQLEQDSVQAARYTTLWGQKSVAKVDYEKAQLAYKNAQKNLEAAVESYNQLELEAEQKLINSRVSYEVSSESLRHVEIRAVVEGKVYQKFKEVGDYVSRGTVIATIGHPTDIYAEVNIDESTISKVKVGQKAIVQLNTNPGETIPAIVGDILPTFDEANQSFTAKLIFDDPLGFRIVGAQLQSNIIVDEVQDALVIPRKYLDYSGHVQLKQTGESVPVKTKTISNEWVHVLDGIDEDTELTVAVN